MCIHKMQRDYVPPAAGGEGHLFLLRGGGGHHPGLCPQAADLSLLRPPGGDGPPQPHRRDGDLPGGTGPAEGAPGRPGPGGDRPPHRPAELRRHPGPGGGGPPGRDRPPPPCCSWTWTTSSRSTTSTATRRGTSCCGRWPRSSSSTPGGRASRAGRRGRVRGLSPPHHGPGPGRGLRPAHLRAVSSLTLPGDGSVAVSCSNRRGPGAGGRPGLPDPGGRRRPPAYLAKGRGKNTYQFEG